MSRTRSRRHKATLLSLVLSHVHTSHTFTTTAALTSSRVETRTALTDTDQNRQPSGKGHHWQPPRQAGVMGRGIMSNKIQWPLTWLQAVILKGAVNGPMIEKPINAKMHFDARAAVAVDPPVADLAANWLCRSARVEEVLRMKHTAARRKSDASSRSERKDTMRRRCLRKPISSSTSVRLEVSESSFARTEHGRGWQNQTKGYGSEIQGSRHCPDDARVWRPRQGRRHHARGVRGRKRGRV